MAATHTYLITIGTEPPPPHRRSHRRGGRHRAHPSAAVTVPATRRDGHRPARQAGLVPIPAAHHPRHHLRPTAMATMSATRHDGRDQHPRPTGVITLPAGRPGIRAAALVTMPATRRAGRHHLRPATVTTMTAARRERAGAPPARGRAAHRSPRAGRGRHRVTRSGNGPRATAGLSVLLVLLICATFASAWYATAGAAAFAGLVR